MAFSFTPNKQNKNRRFYDIRNDLPGFESEKDAKKESQIRQKALIKGGYDDLAVKLTDCAVEYRCESPACPQCLRHNRRGHYHAATAF